MPLKLGSNMTVSANRSIPFLLIFFATENPDRFFFSRISEKIALIKSTTSSEDLHTDFNGIINSLSLSLPAIRNGTRDAQNLYRQARHRHRVRDAHLPWGREFGRPGLRGH